MKLFLDDTREFPTGFDFYCRDTETAKLFLRTAEITFVSFDYNLSATCDESGLDLLVWMAENADKIHLPNGFNIHSDNVFGREDMLEFAKKHFPDAKVTGFTLKK